MELPLPEWLREGPRKENSSMSCSESYRTSQEWMLLTTTTAIRLWNSLLRGLHRQKEGKIKCKNEEKTQPTKQSPPINCFQTWDTDGSSRKCNVLMQVPPAHNSQCTLPAAPRQSIRHSAPHCHNAPIVINQGLALLIFPHDWAYICRAFKSPQFQYFRMTEAELAVGNQCMVD